MWGGDKLDAWSWKRLGVWSWDRLALETETPGMDMGCDSGMNMGLDSGMDMGLDISKKTSGGIIKSSLMAGRHASTGIAVSQKSSKAHYILKTFLSATGGGSGAVASFLATEGCLPFAH